MMRVLGWMLALAALSAQTPKFEAASVKRCKTEGGRGARDASPARLREDCATVLNLIREAYVDYAGGHTNFLAQAAIEGGPSWIASEAYEIDAVAAGAPGPAAMRGPMLQALLEERFQLKIRRESKETPVYALIVAKLGAKLQKSAPGSCVPVDYSLPAPYPQFCGAAKRGEAGLHLIGATMADVCKVLSAIPGVDRPIVDRTGIEGMFDVPLPGPGALAAGSGMGDPSPAIGGAFDAIGAALQRLGLNLDRAKGTREVLVIDHVERPSEN